MILAHCLGLIKASFVHFLRWNFHVFYYTIQVFCFDAWNRNKKILCVTSGSKSGVNRIKVASDFEVLIWTTFCIIHQRNHFLTNFSAQHSYLDVEHFKGSDSLNTNLSYFYTLAKASPYREKNRNTFQSIILAMEFGLIFATTDTSNKSASCKTIKPFYFEPKKPVFILLQFLV